jgi:hypothetical protein
VANLLSTLKLGTFFQPYRLDWVTAGMFAAVLLDTVTSFIFVAQHRGFEQNHILASLIRHSTIWIPIYLFSQPLLVPFQPGICRFVFAFYLGLDGFLCGLNNLGGILFGHYFLVEAIGFPALQGTCVVAALAVFIWQLTRHAPDTRSKLQHLATGLFWLGIFALLQLAFLAIGHLA